MVKTRNEMISVDFSMHDQLSGSEFGVLSLCIVMLKQS